MGGKSLGEAQNRRLPVFSGTPERGIGLAYMAGRPAAIWQAICLRRG